MSRIVNPHQTSCRRNCTINGSTVNVKGKLGQLSYEMLKGITAEWREWKRSDRETCRWNQKHMRAYHGLSRALIQNMVTGVKWRLSDHSSSDWNQLFIWSQRFMVADGIGIFNDIPLQHQRINSLRLKQFQCSKGTQTWPVLSGLVVLDKQSR